MGQGPGAASGAGLCSHLGAAATKNATQFGMKKNCHRKKGEEEELCISGGEFFTHSVRKGKKNGLYS